MKEHAFRLTCNADLKESILKYCEVNEVKAAIVLCGIGSVKEVCIRKAKAETIFRDQNEYEIIALQGTIANGKAHLHIALTDDKMRTIGGHLMVDTIINTTAEIVLMELQEYEFEREIDDKTGYTELIVKRIN